MLFHCAPHGLISGGFLGVDVFFVLSGFLITSILIEQPGLGTFYLRRARRLLPALALMLALYLLVAPFIWPGYSHGRDAVFALYLADYSYTFWRVPLYLQHTWSLAVEEQFYLIWPFIVTAALRWRRPELWLLAGYVAVTLWRGAFGDWTAYYYRFDTHCSGLILGAAIAFRRPQLPAIAALFSGALILAIFAFADIARAAAFIPLAELSSAAIICVAIERGLPLLPRQSLVLLGRLSYGVYLYHFPIAYALRDRLPFVATAALTFALSIGLAWLSWQTVEAWTRRPKPAAGPIIPSAKQCRNSTG